MSRRGQYKEGCGERERVPQCTSPPRRGGRGGNRPSARKKISARLDKGKRSMTTHSEHLTRPAPERGRAENVGCRKETRVEFLFEHDKLSPRLAVLLLKGDYERVRRMMKSAVKKKRKKEGGRGGRERTTRLIRLLLLHLPHRHGLPKFQHPHPRRLTLLPRRFHPTPQRMLFSPPLNRPLLRVRIADFTSFAAT
jgi:hypothetical protein